MPGGGGKGGSGPSGVTTSVQDTSPWGPQQPYLLDVFAGAKDLYQNNTPQYYPEKTLAGPNWAQLAGTGSIMNPEAFAGLPRAAAGSAGNIASGNQLWANPANAVFGSLATTESPEAVALRSYMSGERLGGEGNPYTDALTESVLSRVVPGITSKFISGGTLSSPEAARATAAGATGALAPLLFAQQQQEEQNQINATKQFGDLRLAASGGLSSSFTGGMNDMLRAIALSPGATEALYTPYDPQLQGGAAHQQWQQQAINDAVARWNFGQELPYNKLNQYIGAVTGNYGGNSQLTQPYFNPPGQSPLSTLGQGVGIASGINTLTGGGLMSGLGTLFGFL